MMLSMTSDIPLSEAIVTKDSMVSRCRELHLIAAFQYLIENIEIPHKRKKSLSS